MAMATLYAHTGADGDAQGANAVPRRGSKSRVGNAGGDHIETMADHASERQEMQRRWGTAGDLAFGRRLGETSGSMRFPLGAASDKSPATKI